MSREVSAYHRHVAAANRSAILDAATGLFLASGYDRTSLARVAERAGVSRATLFKQFPTKSALFEATVLAAGDTPDGELVDPPDGDFHAGLVTLGHAYAELLARPRMADLIRLVIAESPKFPELRERTFDFGTLPVLTALKDYLRAENAAGTVNVDDPDSAAPQFLAMIAGFVFWPRLVHGNWSLSDDEVHRVVDEAARTMVSRHAAPATLARRRTIPLLPCADIDEIESFFTALGFRTTYRQVRPNPCLAVGGHGFDLQYYGLDGHDPEASHSSCLVIVDDTGPIWEEFAAGLRGAYGRLPIKGFPRITRPRPRKNAGGLSGFSLIDPAGNWIRFFRDGNAETTPVAEASRLGEAMQNAVVLADSKGDVAQAAKVLQGAVSRAPADDPAQAEARRFLTELTERLPEG